MNRASPHRAGARLAFLAAASALAATAAHAAPLPGLQAPPSPGAQPAELAGQAYARGDYAQAVADAREAVRLAPDERAYQLLLMESLAASGEVAGAQETLQAIEDRFGVTAELEAQRGFYAVRLNRMAAAQGAFAKALALEGLTPQQRRTVELARSDALAALGKPAEALDALAPLAAEPSYEVQSRRAQALLALPPTEATVAACDRAAQLAPTPDGRAYMIRAGVLTRVRLGRKAEARAAFESALASGALAPSAPIDLAMLAVAVGDDAQAQAYFRQARDAGALNARAALDAAYSAKRAAREGDAVPYFELALQRARAGESLPPDAVLAARREVADLSRTWGAYGYLGYGAQGEGFAAGGLAARAATQAGAEVYGRLGGYRGGQTVEVFARAFETVASERSSDPTGPETLQGWAGLRVKLLPDQNLQLEASRMVKLGRGSRNDWMVRSAYSAGTPQDPRAAAGSWWSWSFYLDVAHVLDNRETLGFADLRVGRSFQVGRSGNTILTPFLGVEANYDDGFARPWANGAGPGLSLRQWFRGTPDRAPQSSAVLTVQYRASLGGEPRGRGVFAVLSVAY